MEKFLTAINEPVPEAQAFIFCRILQLLRGLYESSINSLITWIDYFTDLDRHGLLLLSPRYLPLSNSLLQFLRVIGFISLSKFDLRGFIEKFKRYCLVSSLFFIMELFWFFDFLTGTLGFGGFFSSLKSFTSVFSFTDGSVFRVWLIFLGVLLYRQDFWAIGWA